MNRRPPQPLDAEERALAARLPRPQGRSEPGADLDARILAAARTAIAPARPGTVVRRRSWIAPTAIAASLLLAVGLAWQLRPPPALEAPVPGITATSAAADAGGDAMASPALEAAPAPAAVAAPSADLAQHKPVSQPLEPPREASLEDAISAPHAEAENTAIAAAPPPAPPAPAAPAPAVADEFFAAPPPATEQVTAPARVAAPALAKSAQTGRIARESAATAGNAPMRQQTPPARPADNATLDTTAAPRATQTAGEPDEEVPPATADAPEVRDAWLKRIGELLKQGKHDEAKASLTEFRRRYPDVSLPPDLRKLEP